jgi:hypothetical protein
MGNKSKNRNRKPPVMALESLVGMMYAMPPRPIQSGHRIGAAERAMVSRRNRKES